MQNTPKLKITYSWIYDKMVYEWRYTKDKEWNGETDKNTKYAQKLQNKWNKIEKRAFSKLAEVSKLKWKENRIICYVLPDISSFSDPMTIRISKDFESRIEAIIHELAHRLEYQNMDKIDWKKFDKKFGSENSTTYNHILVHAILQLAYLDLFGKRKTSKIIKFYSRFSKEYADAWEIVKYYGSSNIISDFIK